MDSLSTLEHLDRALLTGPVRQALGRDAAEVTAWQAEAFHHGMAEVYRVVGSVEDRGETVPFALVLKVARVWGKDEPDFLFYWKREPLLYQSGLLFDLPGGVFAPRCLGVDEPEPGLTYLWLEELRDRYRAQGMTWSLPCYGWAARSLGHFNGAYLVNRSLPAHPWLSQQVIPRLVDLAAEPLSQLKSLLAHPLVRRACPATSAERLIGIFQERQPLLDLLASLPQTFCHRDTASSNLFLAEDCTLSHRLGLIDWTLAGQGAVGEEIGTLLMTSLLSFEVAPTILPAFEEIIVCNYLEGLHEVGWEGDAQLARLGFLSAAILRFGLNFLAGMLPSLANEATYPRWERAMGRSIEEIVDRRAQVLDIVFTYADETKRLMQRR